MPPEKREAGITKIKAGVGHEKIEQRYSRENFTIVMVLSSKVKLFELHLRTSRKLY